MKQLEHYGARGNQNKWFASYLSNKKQFIFLNGHNSNLVNITCRVLQSSILRPLLFLIYINDLNLEIKHFELRDFADDINLINFNNSTKSISILVKGK